MTILKDSKTVYLLAGLAIIATGLANPTYAQSKAPQLSRQPFLLGAPVDLAVSKPPSAFRGSDGKTHLTYELHITNFGHCELLVRRIEIQDVVKSTVLASYSGQELEKRVFRPGTGSHVSTSETTGEKLGIAARILVFISLDFAGPEVPTQLRHGVLVSAPGFPAEGEETALGAKIAVAGNVRTIGPPVHSGPWLATNGPSNDSGHRRAAIAVDGSVRIAQRFATDWEKGGEDGETL